MKRFDSDIQLGELPDLFTCLDGSRLTDNSNWPKRRKELLDTIVPLLYGGLPPKPDVLKVTHLFFWRDQLDSYLIETGTNEKTLSFELQLHVPEGKGPFPVLLTGDGCFGYCTEAVIKEANTRGYIVAKFNRTVLARDEYFFNDRVGGLYDVYPNMEFGALSAWAWGYHRCIDALEQIPIADSSCIAITGHSRGGKTTLLAAATDERVLFVQDSASGAGGGGCFRYEQYVSEDDAADRDIEESRSEQLKDLKPIVPYWFGPNIWEYIGKEDTLPFDHHFLKAAIAPRWLLLTNSIDDIWANPRGSYLTYMAAREIYQFLGVENHIAANYRRGSHYHRLTDFFTFLDFIDAAREGQPYGGRNAEQMLFE